MSTFNFTVRAMDDQKAFSDRQFSINVKNDQIVSTILADGSSIWTSTDFGTDALIQRPTITTSSIMTGNPVAYGNGTWVASNSTSYYTSPDGINWTSRSYPTVNDTTYSTEFPSDIPRTSAVYFNITFKSNTFILMVNFYTSGSRNALYIFTSDDAVNWTQMGNTNAVSGSLGSSYFYAVNPDIVYDGTTIYFIYGTTSSSSALISSSYYVKSVTDPSTGNITWTSVSIKDSGGTARSVMGLYYINGLWIAANTTSTYLTSNDLVTWTTRSSGITSRFTPFYYVNGSLVTFFSSVLMSGSNKMGFYSSNDGVSWKGVAMSASISGTPEVVMYNGSLYVTPSNSTTLYMTSDGATSSIVNYAVPSTTIGMASIT